MKYYAVKIGKTPGVYTTWDACSQQVTGYSGAVFRRFNNEEAAHQFINETDETAAVDITSPYAYVDGSFNSSTNTYGFGGFLVTAEREYVLQGSGTDPKRAIARNVAGEIDGCMAAVQKALDLHLPSLVIYYDYQGIESFATQAYKARTEQTRAYRDYMSKVMKRLKIKFVKVAGHTGVSGNERADRLAKEAVGNK